MRTMDLYCNLTRDEEHAKGDRIATIDAEVETAEEELKHRSSSLKTQIKGLKAEARRLSRHIREHKELRPVEIVDRQDAERMIVETVRKDTFAVVESRPMTTAEIQKITQPELPLGTNLTPKCKGGIAGCDHHDDPIDGDSPTCEECGAEVCAAHGHAGGDDDAERACSKRIDPLKATLAEILEHVTHGALAEAFDDDEPMTVVEVTEPKAKRNGRAKKVPVVAAIAEEDSDEDEPMQVVE